MTSKKSKKQKPAEVLQAIEDSAKKPTWSRLDEIREKMRMKNMLISMPRGAGKTSLMLKLAAEKGYKVVTHNMEVLDPADLRGLPVTGAAPEKSLRQQVIDLQTRYRKVKCVRFVRQARRKAVKLAQKPTEGR